MLRREKNQQIRRPVKKNQRPKQIIEDKNRIITLLEQSVANASA